MAKIRALTCLLAHPELRSIPLPRNVPVTHWIPFEVPAGISSLDELAKRLGVDAGELKTYNQGYRNGRIVAGAPRNLLVPAGSQPRWKSVDAFESNTMPGEAPAAGTPGRVSAH